MKTFGSSIFIILSANTASAQDFGRVLAKGSKSNPKTLSADASDLKGAKSAKRSNKMSMQFEYGYGAKSLKQSLDPRMSMEFVAAQEEEAPFVLLRTKTHKSGFVDGVVDVETMDPPALSLEYIPMGSKNSKVGSTKIEKGQESSVPKTFQTPKKKKTSVVNDASAPKTMEFSLKYVKASSKSNKIDPFYASKSNKTETTMEKTKETSTSKTKTSTKKAPSIPTLSPVTSKYTATKSSKDSIPISITRSITLPEDTDSQVSQANKSDASGVTMTKGNAQRMAALVVAVGAVMVV
ncbi:hypothetical protein ACHAW6_004433 [Cyclotella cf. meneghiniana]